MQPAIVGPTLIVSSAITEADTNTTVNSIEVPTGAFVPPFGISIYIPEIFAGGSPLLDVGDSDDGDGWIDQTEITAGTLGTYSGVAAALAVSGKYYPDGSLIKVVVSNSLTGGTAYVTMRYYDFSDLDLAAVV